MWLVFLLVTDVSYVLLFNTNTNEVGDASNVHHHVVCLDSSSQWDTLKFLEGLDHIVVQLVLDLIIILNFFKVVIG